MGFFGAQLGSSWGVLWRPFRVPWGILGGVMLRSFGGGLPTKPTHTHAVAIWAQSAALYPFFPCSHSPPPFRAPPQIPRTEETDFSAEVRAAGPGPSRDVVARVAEGAARSSAGATAAGEGATAPGEGATTPGKLALANEDTDPSEGEAPFDLWAWTYVCPDCDRPAEYGKNPNWDKCCKDGAYSGCIRHDEACDRRTQCYRANMLNNWPTVHESRGRPSARPSKRSSKRRSAV